MTEAYPLQWPDHKPRTKTPKRSAFSTSQQKAQTGLMRELKLLSANNIVLSSNMNLRGDGLPYANQAQPLDTGVAVYFIYRGDQVCFCCDRWDVVKDNTTAVMHTIAALRGIARWGTGDMVAAAFKGFVALPPPMTGQKPWYEVIGVSPDVSIAACELMYRQNAKKHHPDNGGSEESMAQLNEAIRQARELKG